MKEYLSIDLNSISQRERFSYLLTAIGPRPIAFASTVDKDGQVNLAPYSFFNAFSTNPPILVFSPAVSARDGSQKHTYHNVKEHAEVVINVVNFPMVQQMSLASTAYAKGVNEFIKAGFTEISSDLVSPPRVAESPVAFECKVRQVIELGTEGGAGNMVISEVLKMHIHPDYLTEENRLDTVTLDLVGRLGGNWYCRASGDALFEVEKPLSTLGIGIDNLPDHIKNSDILTGNNLGMLGNMEALPTQDEISKVQSELADLLDQESENTSTSLELLAQAYLLNGDSHTAMCILMGIEKK